MIMVWKRVYFKCIVALLVLVHTILILSWLSVTSVAQLVSLFITSCKCWVWLWSCLLDELQNYCLSDVF